jgi:adenylate cyclase
MTEMRDNSKTVERWPWIISGLLVVVFVTGWYLPAMQLAEKTSLDLRTTQFGPVAEINDDIIFVTITEDLLSKLSYRSPVDRGVLASQLSVLEKAGPKAVLIDLLFDQPTELRKDRHLREILKNYTVPLVVASAGRDEGLSADQLGFLDKFLDGVTPARANLFTDTVDNRVRWLPGLTDFELPGMAASIAGIAGANVPDERFRILYKRPVPGNDTIFRRFPIHMVPFLPKQWLAGKIIIVGADLPHSDRHSTPVDEIGGDNITRMAGALIHAHGIAQLLEGRFFIEFGVWADFLLFALLSALGAGLAMRHWPWAVKLLAGGGVLVGFYALNCLLFARFDIILPMIGPASGLFFAFFFCSVALEYIARQQRQFIRDAFAQYISPGIVDHLLDNPDRLNLGGEVREVTYLFTDLAGFTALTEKTEPKQLVQILNDYIDGMCTILFKYGGTLDKIVGDAVVAFFNAPVDQTAHGALAVACAVEMDAFSETFRKQKNAEGIDLGITRIGVHSGPAIVGNFGGKQIFDYTSHGDTVNTAARLESVNKHLGTRICVSASAMAYCEDICFRPVAGLVLKGKVESVNTFEPVSDKMASETWFTDYLDAFGLLSSDEVAAKVAFQTICDQHPTDPLSRFHLQRLESGEKGTEIVMDAK